MPFGDGRSWVLPWRRVQPIPCEEIGDTTAGASSNIKTIIDNVRRYRGNVANTAALAALTGNTNGDIVLLLDNGSSITEWRRFNSTGSTWDVVGGGGGGLTSFNTRTGAVTLTNADVNGTISATAAGSTPTTYFGTGASDCIFVATSNGLVINSNEHIIANIDSTAGGTAAEFRVNINAQSATGGTNVFKVTEAGDVTAIGTVTATDLLPSGSITLGSTTAGSSPTSFVGTTNQNSLYVDATAGTVINSQNSVKVLIDADNNSTGQTFKVTTNSGNTTGGTDLLTIDESGNTTIAGNLTVTGTLDADTLGGASPATTATASSIVKTLSTGKIDGTMVAGMARTVRVLTTGASTTLALTDDILVINKSSGSATTVNLPSSPATGLSFVIKDGKGDAATNNITIDPDGATTIDGAATAVFDVGYAAITVFYNGTEWNIL